MSHHPTTPTKQRTVTIIEIEGSPTTDNVYQAISSQRRCEYQIVDLQDENEIARLASPSQAHGKAFDYALRSAATLVLPPDILVAMQNEQDEREREHDRWIQEFERNPPF